MGYSRSDKAVKRVQPILEELVKADKDIEWMFSDPNDVAYKIYDGIKYAIRSEKKEYEKYAGLLNKFRIRVTGKNTVKAELKPPPILSPAGYVVRVDSPDALEIISAAMEQKKDRMFFPNIVLDDDNQQILTMWCKNSNHSFEVKPEGLELTTNV